MDRRGWLWKKRPSDKITKAEKEKPLVTSDSIGSTLSSVAHLGDKQENFTNKNYVQISMESYTHMSGLEDQVVNLEDQVKALEAKLSAAYSELNNKDDLVKQHAKVAEEAVSGWEKADAEVVSLRDQLESITLSKLSVDERASHLDGALKECMKQIRTVKEESEQKLQEVILMKSQQWEKIKLELETQIHKLDKGLREEAGENAALLRSLQESSNKIVKLKEEKSEAENEVELLKKNLQSYEKEIKSLKYELHIVSKEMDIRNEEKNMIMKSAEVANKRHTEDVKTIAKLEGECQRLRGLLRKKLPGPAALAQMKLEVESSRDVINLRKTSSLQECEFHTKQLMALEEETKRLKEALASSNAELQASKNLYAKTVGRLESVEAEIQALHQERSAQKSVLATNDRNSSRRISSNSPSTTSISDSWHGDPESPVESRAASIPHHFDIRRVRNSGKFDNHKSETISELMDDFLEVEKMACSSDNGSVQSINKVKNNTEDKQSDDTPKALETSCFSPNQNCVNATNPTIEHTEDSGYLKGKKLMLQENAQLLAELKAELASSHKSYNMAEIQLRCMTESYKSLQIHAEELEAENKVLKEKIDELKNDLDEEKQCRHDALMRYKEIEEKMQRDKCMVCASNSAANNDINTRKDTELAAAEKKLAECQETLHVLDEIDHAEACSVSSNSDIQGVIDEFSSQNFGSTSCLSDTEGSHSLNSESSQTRYMVIESNSRSSASATGKHAHGSSHFFSSKEKTSYY